MIAADQPTVFPEGALVRVSSRNDGTMLDRSGTIPREQVLKNRYDFCQESGVDYDDLVHQVIVYGDDQTYDHIEEVDDTAAFRLKSDGVRADALFTRTPGVGFFLPVADCVATVIYDPRKKYLAILHLGRHSTLTDLLPNMIQKFIDEGSNVADLIVWMGPSATRASYRLEWFDRADDPDWLPFRDVKDDGIYLDMQGYNRQRCLDAGIPAAQIHVSPVDTMADKSYFSHAMGDAYGRIAVIAMLR